MRDEKTIGSLIIEEQKHLQEFSDPSLRYFPKTIRAGEIGRILGKVRNLEVIPYNKLQLFAADIGIYDERIISQMIVPALEKTGAIQPYMKNGDIFKIEENISSEEEILKIVGETWTESNPSDEESISIDAINICSEIPRLKGELDEEISSLGFKSCELGIDLATKFGILQKYDIPGVREPVFHTPYYARENTQKIIHTIGGLESEDKKSATDILQLVSKNQSTPLSSMKSLQKDIIDSMQQIGLLDCTKVETASGVSEKFYFTPGMWNPLHKAKYNDEQEHIRAILSCVKFGQISPSKVNGIPYKIKMPDKYINALIQRGKIGPSSPIGSDYIVLEKEGIVRIEESDKKGQYQMHLIKEDVAKSALRIITQGRDMPVDESNEEGTRTLSDQKGFDNTVQNRLKDAQIKKKPVEYSVIIKQKLLEEMRGGYI
ncbi:MAG: hypothetical protein PHV39_03710 [Methanomicrobium sp.]|nr:hypothetical protein [Methanomicrobium sp.]